MKRFILAALLIFTLSGYADAAILVMSTNGTYTTKTTLEVARTALDVAGKTVVVTTALTEAQSNITAAWPADRALRVEKGGSIANSTTFTFIVGTTVMIPDNAYVFKGTGAITGLLKVSPEWWGAKADALTASAAANTLALNAAFANSGASPVVFSTGTYYHNGLTLPTAATGKRLKGAGKYSTILKNIGTADSIKILRPAVGGGYNGYYKISDLTLEGNGALYGVGATTLHGINADGIVDFDFTNLAINGHGGYGIFLGGNAATTSGTYTGRISTCSIGSNVAGGVSVIALNSSDQKNNISITGNNISYNGGNACTLWGFGISVTGQNALQGNLGYGVSIHPGTAANYSAGGINIDDNYFELNSLGAFNISAAANGTAYAIASDISFSKNSVSSDGITPVKFTLLNGASYITNPPIRAFTMKGNRWSTSCPTVLADFNNMIFSSSLIDISGVGVDVTTRIINYGASEIVTYGKKKVLQGTFFASGTDITFPVVPGAASNNVVISGTAKTVYFPTMMEVGQQFTGIDVHIYTDSTNYAVTFVVRKRNALDYLSSYATAKTNTFSAQTGSGVKSLTFGSGSDGSAFRVNETLNDYMFYIQVTGTPGTYFYIGNPVINYN